MLQRSVSLPRSTATLGPAAANAGRTPSSRSEPNADQPEHDQPGRAIRPLRAGVPALRRSVWPLALPGPWTASPCAASFALPTRGDGSAFADTLRPVRPKAGSARARLRPARCEPPYRARRPAGWLAHAPACRASAATPERSDHQRHHRDERHCRERSVAGRFRDHFRRSTHRSRLTTSVRRTPALVDHDGLSRATGLPLIQHVERLARVLAELDHRARSQRQQLAHRHPRMRPSSTVTDSGTSRSRSRLPAFILRAGALCGLVCHGSVSQVQVAGIEAEMRTALRPRLTPATPVIKGSLDADRQCVRRASTGAGRRRRAGRGLPRGHLEGARSPTARRRSAPTAPRSAPSQLRSTARSDFALARPGACRLEHALRQGTIVRRCCPDPRSMSVSKADLRVIGARRSRAASRWSRCAGTCSHLDQRRGSRSQRPP